MLQAHNFISWIQDWSIQSLYSDVSKVLEAGDEIASIYQISYHIKVRSYFPFLYFNTGITLTQCLYIVYIKIYNTRFIVSQCIWMNTCTCHNSEGFRYHNN